MKGAVMTPEREELALSIDEAEWGDLRAHLERDGLILVSDTLDLADTAWKVACDDLEIIQHWVENGLLAKPSHQNIRTWDEDRQKRFAMLIVSPYILIQEKVPVFH